MGALNLSNNEQIQQALIDAVERTGNIKTAAEETGVGRSSIYRLMDRDENFNNQITQARLNFSKKMTEDFQAHAPEALETLLSVIRNEDAPATARTNTAKAIIDYSKEWADALDMDTQIKRLQDSIAQAEHMEKGVVNG